MVVALFLIKRKKTIVHDYAAYYVAPSKCSYMYIVHALSIASNLCSHLMMRVFLQKVEVSQVDKKA